MTGILSDEMLARLRAGWSRPTLHTAIRGVVNSATSDAQGWMDFVMDELYESGPLDARDRELVIIGLLAGRKEIAPLAFHVYWGLMEGISVEQIVRVVTLAATYNGVSAYVEGQRVVAKVLSQLAEQATKGEEACQVDAVLPHLVALFPA